MINAKGAKQISKKVWVAELETSGLINELDREIKKAAENGERSTIFENRLDTPINFLSEYLVSQGYSVRTEHISLNRSGQLFYGFPNKIHISW